MATISKFYFHAATTTVTGILPSASSQAAQAPGVTASGASTNRAMNDIIGLSQTSLALTTLAQTTQQLNWFGRFVSPPLAAQTITATNNTWTYSVAMSQSNTSSHFALTAGALYIWRPSSGTKVADIWDKSTGVSGAFLGPPSTTSEGAFSNFVPGTSGSQTCLDGDVLIFEVWADNIQTMATAYTNSFFYDGTTEASATNCASFLAPPSALTLFVPSSLVVPSRTSRNMLLRR